MTQEDINDIIKYARGEVRLSMFCDCERGEVLTVAFTLTVRDTPEIAQYRLDGAISEAAHALRKHVASGV